MNSKIYLYTLVYITVSIVAFLLFKTMGEECDFGLVFTYLATSFMVTFAFYVHKKNNEQ